MRVVPESLALLKHQEFPKFHLIDPVANLLTSPVQGGRVAPNQVAGPTEIVSASVVHLERAEERVVFQPVRLLAAKLLVCSLCSAGGARAEVRPGECEQAILAPNDCR